MKAVLRFAGTAKRKLKISKWLQNSSRVLAYRGGAGHKIGVDFMPLFNP